MPQLRCFIGAGRLEDEVETCLLYGGPFETGEPNGSPDVDASDPTGS